MKPLLIRSIPVLLWASVIFATSCTFVPSKRFVHAIASRTSGHLSQNEFQIFWEKWWWVFVKGYHVTEFFLLTLFLWIALKPATRLKVLWISIAAAAYAASDEYHQTFVPGRGGKVTDVLIDCIGITIATLLICFVVNQRKPNAGAS